MDNKKFKVLLLVTTSIFSFSSCYCQYILSPMANEVMTAFNMNQAQFSRVFSSAMLPGLLLSFVFGLIVDKYGYRKPIMITLVIGAVALTWRIFVKSFFGLFLCTFLPGLAATALNSSRTKIFNDWFDPSMISICLGLGLGTASFGSAVGTGTTAMLPSLKTAFVISAVIEILVLVLWFLFVKDKETKTEETTESEPFTEAVKKIFKNRSMLVLFAVVFLFNGAYMIISTFLPLFLQGRGMSDVAAGASASIISVGYLVGCLAGPILNTALKKTKILLMSFSIVSAVLMFLVNYIAPGLLLTIELAVLGFAIGSAIPIFVSLVVNVADEYGEKNIGTASGICATFQLGGCVLLPGYILAPIVGDNTTLLFFIGAILFGVCAFLITLFSKKMCG